MTYVGVTRQAVPTSTIYIGIYEYGKEVVSQTPPLLSEKIGSFSMDSMYGYMWKGKRKEFRTPSPWSWAREAVVARMPYMGISGRGKVGSFMYHDHGVGLDRGF